MFEFLRIAEKVLYLEDSESENTETNKNMRDLLKTFLSFIKRLKIRLSIIPQ